MIKQVSNFRFNCISPYFIRKMSTDVNDVIFEEKNCKGIITLNRPKALNALNLSMVQKINPVLKQWEKDKMCVIVKGAGDKAFCAGGDVKSLVLAGLKGEKLGQAFFKSEYTMNGIIGNYPIPYISLINGIVMGGGVGISVHGRYRVVTEKALFAMPETLIGLFPDVGGSYFLPRLPGRLGHYLALTGFRLKGADLVHAGIATHYCLSNKIEQLENDIIDSTSATDINCIIERICDKPEENFVLASNIQKIDHCFGANTIEEIFKRLECDGSKWGADTLATLKKMSPTSLKVSLRLLERGSKLDLLECLKMEYRVAVACLNGHDFFEGVRALLIDKDQSPKWMPESIPEVTDGIVEKHFQSLPLDEELKHKL